MCLSCACNLVHNIYSNLMYPGIYGVDCMFWHYQSYLAVVFGCVEGVVPVHP